MNKPFLGLMLALLTFSIGCSRPLTYRRPVGKAGSVEITSKFDPYNTVVLRTPTGNAAPERALILIEEVLKDAAIFVRHENSFTPSPEYPAVLFSPHFNCLTQETTQGAVGSVSQGVSTATSVPMKNVATQMVRTGVASVQGTFTFTDFQSGQLVHTFSLATQQKQITGLLGQLNFDPTLQEQIKMVIADCVNQFADHYKYDTYHIPECKNLPTTAVAFNYLNAKSAKPDYKAAESELRAAVDSATANPKFDKKELATARFLLGLALEGQKRFAEAIEQYEQAIILKSDPQFSHALNFARTRMATSTPKP